MSQRETRGHLKVIVSLEDQEKAEREKRRRRKALTGGQSHLQAYQQLQGLNAILSSWAGRGEAKSVLGVPFLSEDL